MTRLSTAAPDFRFRATIASLATALLFTAANRAAADVVYEHAGSQEPTESGWTRGNTHPGVTRGPGAFATSLICEYPCTYWEVADRSSQSGSTTGYTQPLNDTQINNAGGWAVRARVQVAPLTEGVADPADYSASAWLRYTPSPGLTPGVLLSARHYR